MKRLGILVLLLTLAAGVIGATGTQTDGRLLLREVTYTLNADGSWIRDFHQLMRYNTHTATRRMGETFILYNPEFQKLEAIQSVTTMKDGTRVVLPENATNPVLPRAAHEHPGFSHLREMVVTHTGLERGAVVDFTYRLITDANFQPGFAVTESLAEALPMDRLVIKVKADAGRQLAYTAATEIEPKVTEKDGKKIWTWVIENLPPACAEPHMPNDQAKVLLIGERRSWESILKPLDDPAVLSGTLQERLKEMAHDTIAVADRVVKVGKMVDQAVDLCEVPLNLSGWRYRSPEQVWKLHSGTALEKALLYHAALKSAGLSSRILVYSNRGWLDAEGPVLPQVEGFLVEVHEDDERSWYLDPMGNMKGLLPHNLAGTATYRVGQNRFERLPVFRADQNLVDLRGEWRVDGPDKVGGWLEVELTGAWLNTAEVMENAGKAAQKIVQPFLPLGKMEVESIRAVTPSSLRVRFTLESVEFDCLAPGVLACRNPQIPHFGSDMIALDRRLSVLAMPHPFQVKIAIKVVSGKKVRLEQSGKDALVESGGAAFSRSQQSLPEGGSLFSWALTVPARIETGQYPNFRSLAAKALRPGFWFTLVFPDSKR